MHGHSIDMWVANHPPPGSVPDKCSSEQQFCNSDVITFNLLRRNFSAIALAQPGFITAGWLAVCLTVWLAAWLAGWLVDEMQVNFEFLNLL